MFTDKAVIMARVENYVNPDIFLQSNEYAEKSYFTPPLGYSTSSNLNKNIASINPDPRGSNKNNNLIEHEHLNILGSTTNTLIYCLLDNSPSQEFTRVSIREAIDKHVKALKEDKDEQSQHIARIQTGKAAINYWIDRMVESGTFDKKHTKPVKFWIKKQPIYQRNVINHRIPRQLTNHTLRWSP